MKPAIIITIAVVLLLIPSNTFAQENDESPKNFVRNGTDTRTFVEDFDTDRKIPNTSLEKIIQEGNRQIETLENKIEILETERRESSQHYFFWGLVIPAIVALGSFVGGYLFTKKQSKDLLESMIKALNIDRILDGRDEDDAKLFVDNGRVKGKKKVSASSTSSLNIVKWDKKKIITKDGERDLTEEEIKKYSQKPGIRKTPL